MIGMKKAVNEEHASRSHCGAGIIGEDALASRRDE